MKRLIILLLLTACDVSDPRTVPPPDDGGSSDVGGHDTGTSDASQADLGHDAGPADLNPFETCSQPCSDPILSSCELCNGVPQCVSPTPYCKIWLTGTERNGAFESDGCGPNICEFQVESRDAGIYFRFHSVVGEKTTETWFNFRIDDFTRIQSGVEFVVTGDSSYVQAHFCTALASGETTAIVTWTSEQGSPLPVDGSVVTIEMRSPVCNADFDAGTVAARAEAVFYLPQ